MDGFRIICLKCGKETLVTQGEYKIEKDNDAIDIDSTDYDGAVSIWCDCGNDIDMAKQDRSTYAK